MVEQKYIDDIFASLTGMDLQLDPNPIEFGPQALNEKTAILRGFLSATEKIFMEISHKLAKFKRDLLVSENEYKISITRLIAEDPHVRSGRSQAEREAFAQSRLSELTNKIDDLKLAVNDLDELLKVIKAKRTDLKDLQGRLRDQLKLCQEQIALGQKWGSSAPPPTLAEVISTVPTVDDLDAIFAEALGENQSKKDPSHPFHTQTKEDDINGFLSADLADAEVEEEIDLSDILNNI